MAGEYGIILKVMEPIRSLVFDAAKEYVGYIRNCDDNLEALHKSLNEVCIKKDDVNMKVKVGNAKLEGITREAANWLHDVRILTEDEELKELMYKDIETAKFVVKMMGKMDIKRRISKESEMQEVVVKVMKKLKEEMEHFEEGEMKKIREVDYKQVAEVVVEVLKDTIDEFKKLMKEDKKMAIIAMRTLKVRDLDKLTNDDEEMKEIVREARTASDEESWLNYGDEAESSLRQPLLVETPLLSGSNNNTIKVFASKLFTPLANLVIPIGKLMDDADFKNAVPEAEGVMLGLEVIEGLLIKGRGLNMEMDGNIKQRRSCSLSLFSDYHGRYLMSKAAELLAKHIHDDIIGKLPPDPVTLHIGSENFMHIPTQFLKGLDSRTTLLLRIVENLNDDNVHAVGLFGMGGTGKTTLAKEVMERVKDAFTVKVIVEISHSPDFVRIQAAIAQSIDLPLDTVDEVGQRAIRLYNRLTDLEKEKKILIIMDNVWKKLDLNEIGIPRTCKLLLTTRDKEVCRLMDVRDVNIFEVGVMKINEARELFKSQIGNEADLGEYKNVIERLLSKCGGLPLTIVATANSLKDKDFSSWENFAEEVEKPISSQYSGDHHNHNTFSILNTSYKFIKPKEKRIFFLLVCLSPVGSSISVESLMRYGMGLRLFEHVNKLSEAMKRAVTWADELMLSSMLLQGDVKGDVKIHDIVRDFGISYVAKEEEHLFLVEGVPRWLEDESLKKYTAMSLTSKSDYSRLNGVEAFKLHILILKGDLSPKFDEFFFSGMVNLEVLALSSMNFHPSLPESMRKLEKLKTLCMEGCKLGSIELVGELVNLLILSLRESSLESLPNEIGNLSKLRLLDLNRCTSSNKLPMIPAHVLNKLSRLEGLYLYTDKKALFKRKSDYEEAVATENYKLPYLNAFEIKVAAAEEGLPIDEQFISNLDKFKICFGKDSISDDTSHTFSGILSYYGGYGVESGSLKENFPNILLKKADYLGMSYTKEFVDLVPQFDHDGFRILRSLKLSVCNDMKCIADGRSMSNLIAFPCLEDISLSYMESLEMVCYGDVSPQSFANLHSFRIFSLDKLLYGLSLVPRNLEVISLYDCKVLKFVFIQDEDVPPINMPFLTDLMLASVPSLVSLVGLKEGYNNPDTLQSSQYLFDGKIVLPSLKVFALSDCNDVVKLWSKQISAPELFHNLKNITIQYCEKLSSVGSAYVFTNLVQLEELTIKTCNEMREVISSEETQESKTGEQIIRFPQLTCLKLENLSNLECFYGGESKLDFPKLKTLILDQLGNMNRFAKFENSSALFHKKINFPSLEELQVTRMNDEVMGQWDKQSSSTTNPAPMLRNLTLGSSSGLQQLSSVILKNLSSVTFTHFHDDDTLFSSSNSGEEEGFVSIYSQLPNLENLTVEDSQSLKELFGKEELNVIDDTLTMFCAHVKSLELTDLPSLNLVPLHLFRNISSLTLWGLKWDYLISAHVLQDSLQQLEFLSIRDCVNMEALVINVDSQINFPSLKKLDLYDLGSLIGISSTPKKEATLLLPSLEVIEIGSCQNLELLWTGTIIAPKLQEVSLVGVDLKQVFVGNPEEPIELPSLQIACFAMCGFLESITSASLLAPKLREVTIQQCSKMRCFFPGDQNEDGDLQLLSLESLDISESRNLHAFSLRRVVAPRLTHIEHQGTWYSMLPFDDLNDFLEKINARSTDSSEGTDSSESTDNED